MTVIVAIFANPEDVTNPGYDGRVVRFPVALVPYEHFNTPKEMKNTRNIRMRLEISGSLLACWQFAEAQLIKALYQVARKHLESELGTGTINDELVIQMNTQTQPTDCPFNIEHIDFNGQAVVNLDIRHPIGFIWDV